MTARFPQLAAVAPTRTYRYWNADGWWGDQGPDPFCVAYSWTHAMEDGPFTHSGPAPIVDPPWLYHNAQLVDEWDGQGYDGTSVRAGAKVLQSLGFIESYHWAFDLGTAVEAVLSIGPVVMGTDWYDGMFTPDADGRIRPTGAVAGGHAWKLDGVNVKTRMARGKNSWGRHWGRSGHFWIAFDDLAALIAAQGEACIFVESSPAARAAALAVLALPPKVFGAGAG